MNFNFFSIYFRGVAMGVADIIPGVSGGTIAFVTGIYFRLLNAISAINLSNLKLLLNLNFRTFFKAIDFYFLVSLGLGIGSAILGTSKLITFLLKNYGNGTWSFFIGLILASAILLIFQNKNHFKSIHYINIFLGAIVTYYLVGLAPTTSSNTFVTLFLSGMIAISAMILPGISGSFLLVLLGKYEFVLSLLKNPFVIDSFILLVAFCLGCGIGILLFARLLKKLIEKYEYLIISLLLGVMIGALRRVWPFKVADLTKEIYGKTIVLQEHNVLPSNLWETFIMLIFIFLGCALVATFDFYTKKKI